LAILRPYKLNKFSKVLIYQGTNLKACIGFILLDPVNGNDPL